jgi:hypothetical protein
MVAGDLAHMLIFLLGLFIGAALGVLAMALALAGKD